MTDQNLWGDLQNLVILKTPVTILREQAEVLSRATNGVIIGFVRPTSGLYGEDFTWELALRVPGLNDYVATIATVEHSVVLYPVRIIYSDVASMNAPHIPNEEQFTAALKTILGSPQVRALLTALVSQVSR